MTGILRMGHTTKKAKLEVYVKNIPDNVYSDYISTEFLV